MAIFISHVRQDHEYSGLRCTHFHLHMDEMTASLSLNLSRLQHEDLQDERLMCMNRFDCNAVWLDVVRCVSLFHCLRFIVVCVYTINVFRATRPCRSCVRHNAVQT